MPALRNPGLECSDKVDTPPAGAGVHACDSNSKLRCIPGPDGNTRQRRRFLIFLVVFVIFCLTLFAVAARSRQPEREAASAVMDRFNQFIPTRRKVRHEYAYLRRPYDNGTRKDQLVFAMKLFGDFSFLRPAFTFLEPPDREDHS